MYSRCIMTCIRVEGFFNSARRPLPEWQASVELAGSSRGQEEAPWKMRLACSSINFSSLPIEQAVQRIAGLGFDAIDIWSAHAGCPHLDDVLDRLGPEGLKELLEKHKLDLYSFSVYAGGYPRYAELLGKAGGGVAVRGSGGLARSERSVRQA